MSIIYRINVPTQNALLVESIRAWPENAEANAKIIMSSAQVPADATVALQDEDRVR